MLVRLWLASLRVAELTPASRGVVMQAARPVIFVLWHNRLFLVPEMMRRYRRRPLYALVSPSGDGGWLAAVFAWLNLETVRGSSSRRGREATADALEILGAGHDLGLTPDGPRGPVYEMKPGAVVVARRAGAALVLIGIELHSAWRFASWDGLYLPKPFSRVTFTFEEADLTAGEETEAAARRLGARLRGLNVDRQPAPPRKRG